MHQKAFGGRAPPELAGGLKRFPRPPSPGSTSTWREGKGGEREGKGREVGGKGRKGEPSHFFVQVYASACGTPDSGLMLLRWIHGYRRGSPVSSPASGHSESQSVSSALTTTLLANTERILHQERRHVLYL